MGESNYVLTTFGVLMLWLAGPVIAIWLYDMLVLAPKRPRLENGERAPGPAYVRWANYLVPLAFVAIVIKIGVKEVFDWAGEVAVPLSWAAVPVGLWLAIDSWFLAPRRQIAAGSTDVQDPPLLRAAYFVLPVFVVAVIVRMIRAETLDFSLVLLLLSVATGIVWALDHWIVRPRREALAAQSKAPIVLREPGTIDYARSFFPVAFIVLIVRAFIFEPFRIPSDSMMPTLLDGDFIVVNKYAYGLRLPVINEKFIDTGSPQRGDVVVFRWPPNPSINYIKRLVGLPGDRIEVHDDHLVINGETLELKDQGMFTDDCYAGVRLATETLGTHTHHVMSCRSPIGLQSGNNLGFSPDKSPFAACDRKEVMRVSGGYFCDPNAAPGMRDVHDFVSEVVPAGHYLMIGDNRDNSADSREWGFVPDKNLVGKATRIWFNFDLQRSRKINWSRIGSSID